MVPRRDKRHGEMIETWNMRERGREMELYAWRNKRDVISLSMGVGVTRETDHRLASVCTRSVWIERGVSSHLIKMSHARDKCRVRAVWKKPSRRVVVVVAVAAVEFRAFLSRTRRENNKWNLLRDIYTQAAARNKKKKKRKGEHAGKEDWCGVRRTVGISARLFISLELFGR